jgi:dTDP-4-dehydrorhamnose reductase
MKKIVITGGGGRLANEIYKQNVGNFEIMLAPENELNILNVWTIREFLQKHKPDIVIHAAALTKPMSIHDDDIVRSIDINIIGTANITQICNLFKIKLIYICTDYVYPFDSKNVTETAGLQPINNYGWSKLGGECSVQMYKNSLIIRLSFMEKPFPFPFAYTNIIRNMFYIDDAAKAILSVLDEFGVINIGSEENISLYELAKKTNINVSPSISEDNKLPKIMTLNINKFKKMKEEVKVKTEKCINCGKDTNVPADTPIDMRKNYIEGAGQLCDDCMVKVYGKE